MRFNGFVQNENKASTSIELKINKWSFFFALSHVNTIPSNSKKHEVYENAAMRKSFCEYGRNECESDWMQEGLHLIKK